MDEVEKLSIVLVPKRDDFAKDESHLFFSKSAIVC